MSYQAEFMVKVRSFPGPMTLEEVDKVAMELKQELEKAAKEFLEKKFINVPEVKSRKYVVFLRD